MKLSTLKTGESARILTVGGEGALRQHFLDMGVIPGAEVTLMKLAPITTFSRMPCASQIWRICRMASMLSVRLGASRVSLSFSRKSRRRRFT